MSDYNYDCVVVEVHDGDTVTLDVDLGFSIWHRGMRVRLLGINAPELSSDAGKHSQIYLRNLLPIGSRHVLESHKDRADKYGGRWLGVIRFRSGQSANDMMVEAGFAVRWDGKGSKPA